MADIELSPEDWLELYRFLLERLESKGFLDVRREIEAAAAAPVFEPESEDRATLILTNFKPDVGQRVLRRRETSEVFAAALDVVWPRLSVVPGNPWSFASITRNSMRPSQSEPMCEYQTHT